MLKTSCPACSATLPPWTRLATPTYPARCQACGTMVEGRMTPGMGVAVTVALGALMIPAFPFIRGHVVTIIALAILIPLTARLLFSRPQAFSNRPMFDAQRWAMAFFVLVVAAVVIAALTP